MNSKQLKTPIPSGNDHEVQRYAKGDPMPDGKVVAKQGDIVMVDPLYTPVVGRPIAGHLLLVQESGNDVIVGLLINPAGCTFERLPHGSYRVVGKNPYDGGIEMAFIYKEGLL